MFRFGLFVVACVLTAAPARAGGTEKISVRGQTLSLAIYPPKSQPRGTMIMGSGDVGWVGLAVSLAEEFSDEGYLVVGINVRQYLSSFTSGRSHLETVEEPADYRAIADYLRARGLLRSSGDRRGRLGRGGAGGARRVRREESRLDRRRHHHGAAADGGAGVALDRCRVVDHQARCRRAVVRARRTSSRRVSPLPLVHDPVEEGRVRPAGRLRAVPRAGAREPKQLVLIDASNHRFTDRRPELSGVP